MKIMVIIPTLWGGGAERVVSVLTKEWAKSHQVKLILFDASDRVYDYGGRLMDLRVPPSHQALGRVYNFWKRVMRLLGMLRQERPDRIFSFLETANFPAVVASALTGYLDRLYVSGRSNPSWSRAVFRVLLPWLYRLPAGVVAVSMGVKREMESMGVPTSAISVIPNPIVRIDRNALGQESVSPLAKRFILGVGRLIWLKGFDRLLTTFSGLDQSDIHLVILGKGDEQSTLVNLAQELGVEERVHFPGHVADIETWYRHAECLVLSSRHEGWPNVLMEAMANGCPVVSFNCKYGPSEIIEDGENGLLVPNGNLDLLGAAINRILDDRYLRLHLVVKGLERARIFDAREIALHWLK